MFSAAQLQEISIAVDQQLAAARVRPIAETKDGMSELRRLQSQLVVQQEQIESATQESADRFLQKFGRAARRDLCEEGGLLYEQWKKYADLEN
jgi:uncharacterized protein with PIN domain